MSTATDPVVQLTEQVTVPAYFAKIAADTGINPVDGATALQLRTLGDQVYNGVTAYLQKKANSAKDDVASVVKEAADALDFVGGRVQAPTAVHHNFLSAPGVRDAAAALLAKEASDAASLPVPTVADDEEEEGDARVGKSVVPAAPVA